MPGTGVCSPSIGLFLWHPSFGLCLLDGGARCPFECESAFLLFGPASVSAPPIPHTHSTNNSSDCQFFFPFPHPDRAFTEILRAMAPRRPADDESSIADERTDLLDDSHGSAPVDVQRGQDQVPHDIARRLYVSHFLSAWNSRVFEFGAVLYLATIFPGTLLPMSVYALTRGLSAILFAPAAGQYVDTGDRLQVVRVSIGGFSDFACFVLLA